ncbi:MAG: hypothetical protein FWF09_01645 [Bacteroidales bacterium]|nr:hypothetical protein [Bacteroidales bacterium]
MKTYHEEFEHPLLSKMLRELPLEQPPRNFTEKVMNHIQSIEVESKVYFYQKSWFVGLVSVGFAACFLLFYHAEFSFTVLVKQWGHYYSFLHNYVASLHFAPRQITFSPLIVAPLLLIFCIFIADRVLEAYKKQKQHRIFCL